MFFICLKHLLLCGLTTRQYVEGKQIGLLTSLPSDVRSPELDGEKNDDNEKTEDQTSNEEDQ